MRSRRCRYVGSKEWSLTHEDGFLIASAGADELYAIEDVPDETAAELGALWGCPVDPARLSTAAARLVPQLLNIGALLRDIAPAPPTRVAVTFSGHPEGTLTDALTAEAGHERHWALVESADADLILLVRTGGRLVEATHRVGGADAGPHLLLDIAFHHTVSLGPLVFPDETACLSCLAGRVGQYWGDPVPPQRPAIQREARLISALAVLELDKIAAGDYGLVNATVSLDVRRYDAKRHALYKLPWCPTCGDGQRGETVGLVPLPWAPAA
jgi:bacteriocin biosynthesis cyclodehydratase domain-containing protein